MAAELTQRVSRMTFAGTKGTMARFEAYDDSSGEMVARVSFSKMDWWDFGAPDVLTVTFVPGDLLNED